MGIWNGWSGSEVPGGDEQAGMTEGLWIDFVQASVVLDDPAHQSPNHEIRPNTVIEPLVIRASKHGVREPELIDCAQPLELRCVDYRDGQWGQLLCAVNLVLVELFLRSLAGRMRWRQ